MPDPSPPQPHSSLSYPTPLIIPPLSAHHKHSIIILHGRGDNAHDFGPALLSTKISSTQTFRSAFPHARFIFPTAPKSRATVWNRSVINQWFDNWSLQAPDYRSEIQIEGLRETSAFVHSLIKQEIDCVGKDNVVVGGLSQGCAATLISLLTWDCEPLPAAFGMCGWLPFRVQMEEIALSSHTLPNANNDVVFASPIKSEHHQPAKQTIAFLREHLDLPKKRPTMAFQQTPLFLGHGTADEKVPIGLGMDATGLLKDLGMQVEWRGYVGLEHWYSSKMLGDLVGFLREKTGWDDGDLERGDVARNDGEVVPLIIDK